MTVNRRSFLLGSAAAGLTLGTMPWGRVARAAEPWSGPYWLTLHCAGGWDPTLLCDPKGRASESDVDPVNMYFTDDIEQIGPFRAAPVDGHRAFFERFRDQLLVVNGIDTQTNSHEVGTRHTWSGSMDPGVPALHALVAAANADRPTLAYLTHGGYDVTAGLVAPTRLPSTSALLGIAHPERLDEDEPETIMLPESQLAMVRAARDARLQRRIDSATLPRVERAMHLMAQARSGDNELANLAALLPGTLDSSANPLIRQAQVAMACFGVAGVTMSASMTIGGFDTHGNHDDSHTPRIQQVLDGITFAMDEAERRGIADQIVLVVGSDFARTPWYNDSQGKDHWSITSMMMMGPGIRGGRVVGATDDRQVPISVDPDTLQPSEDGVRISPGAIHAALRDLAGITRSDGASAYPVGKPLPLLG